MITEENEELSSNFEQNLAIMLPQVKEYIDLIDDQTKKTEIDIDTDDYISRFTSEVLNITNDSELEDNSVYFDSNIDDVSKKCLNYFESELESIVENNLGVTFSEPTLFLLKCTYNVLYNRFISYFISYIRGLQQIDENYIDEIPSYNEISYKYFITNISTKKEENSYQNISDYIQYVLTFDLPLSRFVAVALLDAEGDVDLSTLYVEIANFRISTDDEFISSKIKNIISSPICNDFITSKLIDFFVDRSSE